MFNDNALQENQIQILQKGVATTLAAYNQGICQVTHNNIEGPPVSLIDSQFLQEQSTIGHSAFFILATLGIENDSSSTVDNSRLQTGNDGVVDSFVRGILSMQRPKDGAFAIRFPKQLDSIQDQRNDAPPDDDSNVYNGIEFFPGEAMVALMEAYGMEDNVHSRIVLDESTRQAILPAMMRAFDFYSNHYYQGNVDANYPIWQVQAFSRLYLAISQHHQHEERLLDGTKQVGTYVLDLCQDIVNSRAWKEMKRGSPFYPNLQTLEISCGLDALAIGMRVASHLLMDEVEIDSSRSSRDLGDTKELFWYHSKNAITYLKYMQDLVPQGNVGHGGLGFGGLQVIEQRLDVAGHTLSALIKLHEDNSSVTGHV